jgi:uncharacterized protein (TIGR02301 family)
MLRTIAVCLLIAGPALAQERSPADRQLLLELARTIGEAHAIRQVCEGPQDQFWRTRMLSLLEAEAPGFDLAERLRSAFNTGFLERQYAHPACNRLAREAEAEVSARGQALARRLAPSG